MADLTPSQKLEKIEDKKRFDRKKMKAYMTRAAEPVTALVVSPVLGAINAAKPEWKEAVYGLVQPNAIATVLGVIGIVLLRKSPAAQEAAFGMAYAGGVPLLHDGGAKLFDMLTGP